MKQQNNRNIDEIDQLLYDYFDNKEIPEETAELIKSAPHKRNNNQYKITKIAVTIFLCLTMTTGIVFAKDIVGFFKELFSLNSININNKGVIDAIENKDYIQNINMNYIPLNDKYSIKVDYLMMDDINLYVVFNLFLDKEIKADYRISIIDLKISDDNDNIIYDATKSMNDSDVIAVPGWKKINNENSYEKKELLFLMSNGIPKISKLNFEFSKIVLYDNTNPNKNKIEIIGNCNFSIDIIDKFINRGIYEFSNIQNTEKYRITKVIATDTGTYLILETENPEIDLTLQYQDKDYKSNKTLLGINTKHKYEFVMQYNITKSELNKDIILKAKDTYGETISIK